MKTILQSKRFGFYFTLASLVYFLIYHGSNEWNLLSFLALLISGLACPLIRFIPRFGHLTKLLLLGGISVALFAYVYGVYYYVSVVIADIDLHGYSAEFIFLTAFYGLLLCLAIANLFLPFEKGKSKMPSAIRVVASIVFALASLAAAGSYAGKAISFENEGFINSQLHVNPYVMEKGEGSLNTDYFETEYEDVATLREEGEELVAQIEEEGAVLLTNENSALPLNEGDKVSLFSLSSVDPAYGGEGSSAATRPMAPISLVEALEEEGIEANPTLANWYAGRKSTYAPTGYMIKDAPWSAVSGDASLTASFAEYGDAAIFVLKRIRGENTDVAYQEASCDGEGGNYLALNDNEKSVLSALSSAKGGTFGKLIVLLNTPNPPEMAFLEEYGVDACLWIGSVGQTGFRGVARILSGAANPSGKLPDTFYFHHRDNPVMANWGSFTYENYEDYLSEFPSFGGKSYSSMQYASYVAYQEGVYVGYRYSETRYEDCVIDRDLAGDFDYPSVIAFPFGYGLSYTSFAYSNPTYAYEKETGVHSLTLEVKNVGGVSGKESVQLYLQKPYTEYDESHSVEKPSIELVDYAKTSYLSPGESEVLSFAVKDEDFASYDAYGEGSYLIEESSEYRLAFGSSSHQAINNILADKGYSRTDGMDQEGDAGLVKKVQMGQRNFASTSKNLFDSMDINRYEHAGENHIDYLSRKDWIDTIPSNNARLNLTDGMMEDLLSQNEEIREDEEDYPTYGKDNGLKLINGNGEWGHHPPRQSDLGRSFG